MKLESSLRPDIGSERLIFDDRVRELVILDETIRGTLGFGARRSDRGAFGSRSSILPIQFR